MLGLINLDIFWQLSLGVMGIVAIVFLYNSLVRAVKSKTRWENRECENCGYDLRATPERCPECGVVVALTAKPVEFIANITALKMIPEDSMPNQERQPAADEQLVALCFSRNAAGMKLLANTLRIAGIAAWPENAGEEIMLMIWSGDYTAAREIMEHFHISQK